MAKSTSITPAQIVQILAVCDDSKVAAAYDNLGPIANYVDLLDNTLTGTPATCLASEQVIHMVESWRYLGTAMFAFLNNERGNSIHLAYYAELRAALSLFSGSGLRIDRDNGFWIDSTGAKHVLPKHQTHALAWGAWQEWVKRPDAQTLLGNQIRLMPGVTLEDFQPRLQQFNAGTMLSTWGFDLINLQNDHHSRNSASYNAYWRTKPLRRMTETSLDFARKFSELFLSAGSSGLMFDKALVQYLVGKSISSAVVFDGPYNSEKYDSDWDTQLIDIVQFVAKQTGSDDESLLLNLNANIGRETFDLASNMSDEAESVLARAGFMARLAMLSVKRNVIASANPSARIWMTNWLESCGRWDPNSGSALGDLEIDLIDALESLPVNSPSLPGDLWREPNLVHTSVLSNIHSCIAWGVAA